MIYGGAKKLPDYMIFLLLGMILIISGLGIYYVANLSTVYNIPKGAIRIGIGPQGNMTPINTRIHIANYLWDYVSTHLSLQVSFNFTEYRKYYIYVTMPYETFGVDPYVVYHNHFYDEETAQIGNISANHKNFESEGASVINATFTPDNEFQFLPNEPVTLSIYARVHKLVSIRYPLGSKQSVILTFFGDQTDIWDDAMAPYIGIDNIDMVDYPFQVIITFPEEYYLSSDTFPDPSELYVSEGARYVIFNLKFSYPSSTWKGQAYAQSISCSYANPNSESKRSLWTFLSAVVLTTGISFCLESLRRKKKPCPHTPSTQDNGLQVRPIMKIEGRLSKNEILKFTEGHQIEELSEHELGDIGERITKDIIIPKIAGISKVKQPDPQGVTGVPFDIVATYQKEIWLVETKTGKFRFESPQATQKKRMKRILELLAQKGVDTRPVLVQIRLGKRDYRIRDFSIKYEGKGMAPTFRQIVDYIVDYRKGKGYV